MGSEKEDLLNFLLSFLTEERKGKFLVKINGRTRQIAVVLENIFQSHNASAIMRSCDCFGIQDLHVIENSNSFKVNSDIVLGASQWVSVYKYAKEDRPAETCISLLKKRAYKIVVTSPHHHHQQYTPATLPLENKIALVFGTEHDGISQVMTSQADYSLCIPMLGFTESLNVSVSAGVCLYALRERLKLLPGNYQLSPEEKTEVMLQWARASLKQPELLEQEFWKQAGKCSH